MNARAGVHLCHGAFFITLPRLCSLAQIQGVSLAHQGWVSDVDRRTKQ